MNELLYILADAYRCRQHRWEIYLTHTLRQRHMLFSAARTQQTYSRFRQRVASSAQKIMQNPRVTVICSRMPNSLVTARVQALRLHTGLGSSWGKVGGEIQSNTSYIISFVSPARILPNMVFARLSPILADVRLASF